MFKGKKFLILQALFLILLLDSTLIFAKKHVKLINFLGVDQKLTAQCKSEDDDLGTHEISYGQEYEWGFRRNFFGSTKYYCYIVWGNKLLAYDAYDYKRDKKYCGDCKWLFEVKGAFSWNYDQQTWEFRFPWTNAK